MSIGEILKTINTDYGALFNGVITLIAVIVSIREIKDVILSRTTSGLPFLRLEACNDRIDKKKTNIVLKVNPFGISTHDKEARHQHFEVKVSNFGNGPAVDLNIEGFGCIDKLTWKNSTLEKVEGKNILAESFFASIHSLDISNLSIMPNESKTLKFTIKEGNGDRYRFPPFPYISTGRNRFHFPSARGKQVIWSGFFNFFLAVFAR